MSRKQWRKAIREGLAEMKRKLIHPEVGNKDKNAGSDRVTATVTRAKKPAETES